MKIFYSSIGIILLVILIFLQNKKGFQMEERMSFITLGVKNLTTSADFYENKFGWTRSKMSNENIVFYQLDGITFALYERNKLAEDAVVNSAGSGFKGFTLSYLTRSEKEVNDLTDELRKKGVNVIKEPQKVFWGGYHSYIEDPDNNLWEIVFNPYTVPE